MTEAEAKQILLLRAVEEEDPALLSPELQEQAWLAAEDRSDVASWLLRRAVFLLDRLPERVRDLIRFELPPRELGVAVWIAAAAIGVASNGLRTGHRIHALANPVTALVLWNLGVYALVAALHAKRSPYAAGETRSSSSARLQPLLALLARIGVRWSRRGGRSGGRRGGAVPAAAARVRLRFATDYGAVCAPSVLARCARVAHVAAIAFALGALAGTYLQGVAFEYRVEWGSTLVPSAETRAMLAALLFLPARVLMGAGFPDSAQLALAATPEGAPAAAWFHAFAITVVCVVLIPRSLLALGAARRARRLSRSVAFPLEDPHWRRLVERPSGRSGALGTAVLSHFALDADACGLLASLQAALVAEDIGATTARGRFDPLARKKAWYERWRLLVERGFAAFAEHERPRLLDPREQELAAAAARVRRSTNPFAAELVLLELAAFEAYWPLEPRDAGLRDRLGLAPSLQADVRAAALGRAATLLGLPAEEGEEMRRALAASSRALSGLWSKLAVGAAAGTAVGAFTFGLAAPVAVAVLGKAAGLVALKAGLAALGGHAIVGASLGAAGGTVLVVGGGALLGSGPDRAAGSALTPAAALLSGAKIEVFLRRVVAGRHRDAPTFASVLDELRASLARLREELPAFRLDPAHTTTQIQEREQVISILTRVAEHAQTWADRHGAV